MPVNANVSLQDGQENLPAEQSRNGNILVTKQELDAWFEHANRVAALQPIDSVSWEELWSVLRRAIACLGIDVRMVSFGLPGLERDYAVLGPAQIANGGTDAAGILARFEYELLIRTPEYELGVFVRLRIDVPHAAVR